VKLETPFDGKGSENERRDSLLEHCVTKIHLNAFKEMIIEWVNSGLKIFKGIKDLAEKRLEGCAQRFRLQYTCAKNHIPLSAVLPITRVFNSFAEKKGNEDDKSPLQEFGHCYNRMSREILRIIANDLRGWVIFEINEVKYIGFLYDDASDCRQVGLFCEWAKFVYPPPSIAPLNDCPALPTSYAILTPAHKKGFLYTVFRKCFFRSAGKSRCWERRGGKRI
jgi:hypothetical protein